MWALTASLGFGHGRVLEPGCGSGTFLGHAPDDVDLVGVELEPVTARIAQRLYPDAEIRSEGFEHSRFPDGTFDLVIGNVPFAKVALHDPVHNQGRHSIHNHFLIKALHLTRPGGLVVCLTSRFTLDARNPAARRELAALGDLIGAVRLPNGAHHATAGTDVITDLVVLRRRTGNRRDVEDASWERTTTIDTRSGPVEINTYLAEHPEAVLGELGVERGVYDRAELTVRLPTGVDLPARFADACTAITADADRRGLTVTPRVHAPPTPVADRPGLAGKEGSLHDSGTGVFHRIVHGRAARYQPTPNKDRHELAALLALRDAVLAVLEVQAASGDDTRFADAQRELNDRYDTYQARYGPLNRFTLARTGRVDPDTGADRYRRVFPRMGGFAVDPDYQTVLALEHFDPDTHTAAKADIFTHRILGPRPPRLGADTAAEALAVTLDATGHADLTRIAGLLGIPADQARDELGTLVFDDPATGRLEPAERYLAGDVRTKLAHAHTAADRDARYRINVEALTAVVPDDLTPTEIDARLGAPWIPASDIEDFAAGVLAADTVLVEHAPVTATWAVTASTWHRRTVTATSEWGTARADAISLLEASLNQRAATVYDTNDDGARVNNPAETLAAREKQEALEARFSAWLWEDPHRAVRLAGRYNELFNSVVLPVYDGQHLTLPGLAATFDPHPHQRDAVWRILSSGDTLLAHAVGAGKTATMVIAGMELRRLHLATKPTYVVPNHMLEQFARELLQRYPQARLLVATRDDLTPTGRKHFVARCATGDWDAVVVTHSAFERIPLAAATRAAFLAERIGAYRAAAAESANGKGLTVKRLEAIIARLEERHAALQAVERKDDGATFEQTGIDFVFVDEAHAYKNKPFPTRIQGVGGQGSHRAEDLDIKLWWLRQHHDRVACLATATPIANTVAEMYVAQTYLQPAALTAAGIDQFDAWAATFGATVTALELAPDGASYRMTSRFARYRNIPELLTLFRQIADVRTTDQLALPTPRLQGAKPETVIVPTSVQLTDYVASLAERADAVRSRRVDPTEDNMLKISGDGRRAALDLRLVDHQPDPAGGKLAAAADRIAAVHHATRQLRYLDPAGQPSPRPGALQLVFCDLSTPHPVRWNAYDQLRTLLVTRGVPSEQIRFIHDAGNDRAKADLFAACRDGRVSVLVGSTDKMGIGTNVQARAVALHHLDCPWRPADLEQREGRILRQGNQNPDVQILRYATEGSFDIFMWQTVERKAAFINQVMHGTTTTREIGDIGDQALSYAEVKALATGNPLIMEKAGIDNDVARLQRLRTAHHRDQSALTRTRHAALARHERLQAAATACQIAIDRRVDTRGDSFTMTVDGHRFDKRTEAGAQLKHALARLAAHPADTPVVIGQLGAFDLAATAATDATTVHVADTPIAVEITAADLAGTDGARLVQRIEHRLHRLDADRDQLTADAATARDEAERAALRLGAPFDQQRHLDALLQRQTELEALLRPDDQQQTPPTSAPTTAADRLRRLHTRAEPPAPRYGRGR